jgi:hypothetical protein
MIEHALKCKIIPESYDLESFTISILRVIPLTCASIDICVHASNGQIYHRSFQLAGQAYLDWSSDDYLYKYVQDNILEIFNNV